MHFSGWNKYLVSKPLLSIICGATLLMAHLKPQPIAAQIVEETLERDELNVDKSLPWGVKRWPYSKVIEVLDLGDTVYGRVVIDRYGKDESGGLVKRPFSNTKPGKFVFVSMWGSNLDGCYAETVVQVAPKNDINPEATLPTLLEFSVNGELVRLTYKVTNPKIVSYRYDYLGGNNSTQQGIWHMNHRIFPIDSTVAGKLINAPVEDIDARMHFGDSKTIPFTIGKDTVERWQDIYSFNSSCQYVP